MVKLLVLQQWYGLSDEETECQDVDRLSFRRFLGYSERVPDSTTIWLFRKRLAETGKDKEIWAELSRQLDAKGFRVRKGVAQYASFIEADPGGSEPRGEETKTRRSRDGDWTKRRGDSTFGYKLHLSVDPKRILPLAVLVAPANDNEKKHAPSLVERTRMVLGRAGARLRRLIGDSQFSSERVRRLVEDSVIPYTSNQRGEGVLRVDRRFRAHGPEELVAKYRRRPMVESAFSFLKTQLGLTVNRVRGMVNVSVYALLSVLCLVLVREAAENMSRPEKALSPTFFNV